MKIVRSFCIWFAIPLVSSLTIVPSESHAGLLNQIEVPASGCASRLEREQFAVKLKELITKWDATVPNLRPAEREWLNKERERIDLLSADPDLQLKEKIKLSNSREQNIELVKECLRDFSKATERILDRAYLKLPDGEPLPDVEELEIEAWLEFQTSLFHSSGILNQCFEKLRATETIPTFNVQVGLQNSITERCLPSDVIGKAISTEVVLIHVRKSLYEKAKASNSSSTNKNQPEASQKLKGNQTGLPFLFQPIACEFEVSFPSKPRIYEVKKENASGSIVPLNGAELILSKPESLLRAEFTPLSEVDFVSISEDRAIGMMTQIAKDLGISRPNYKYESTRLGKEATIWGSKGTSDDTTIIKVTNIFGKTSLLTIYVACAAKDYETESMIAFRKSVKNKSMP